MRQGGPGHFDYHSGVLEFDAMIGIDNYREAKRELAKAIGWDAEDMIVLSLSVLSTKT